MHLPQPALRCWTATLVAISLTVGCGTSNNDSLPTASIDPSNPNAPSDLTLSGVANPDDLIANPERLETPKPRRNLHPEVLISTKLGNITIRLDAENSPETVDNFLENYVEREFYDGTIFHYVEPDFIVSGGGYTTDLEPKETRAPIRNEAHNGLQNKRGTISMSRQADYVDSATSHFFINLADNPNLDHDATAGDEGYGYCVFGKVVAGMDVVERIAAVPVRDQGDFVNLPTKHVVIESIRLLD